MVSLINSNYVISIKLYKGWDGVEPSIFATSVSISGLVCRTGYQLNRLCIGGFNRMSVNKDNDSIVADHQLHVMHRAFWSGIHVPCQIGPS